MTPDEIRDYRDERGLSQADLARALSVDGRLAPATVSRWESGDRKPPPFLRLALKALRRRRRA
jgi:transcriptional regulator with XRE-family HTH domain